MYHKGREEHNGTLAALPVLRIARWQDELSKYDALTPSRRFEFNLHPATPLGGSQRYAARTAVQGPVPVDIPAGQEKFLSALSPIPDGWRRHVHPAGITLFYHEGLRVFTECDISDHEREREVLFCAATLIERAIGTDGVTLDELAEIVINVDSNQRWNYYFVDHTHRLLFWVDPISVMDLDIGSHRIIGYSHIRYMVESHYWYLACYTESRSHCEHYPHNRILPKAVFEDLTGMLNYAKIDMMATNSCSCPFSRDELIAILDLANSLKDNEKISDPYSIWVIARSMSYFTKNQFLNFCGQSCARLNADALVFGPQSWNRDTAFRVVNIFLFGSPNQYAIRLQRVWVDGLLTSPRWRDFINNLQDDLARCTVLSTVMLAVNMSFLAVPGVVTPDSPAGPIQIAIYCSVISTVASIVISFALFNVYSDPELMVARHVVETMWTLSQTKYGMARLAIAHSLPIASLMWSTVLFSTALAVQIFSPRERGTVATVGAECLVIVLFVFMGARVMRLFSREEDVDTVDNLDNSKQKMVSPAGPHDIELGFVQK